MTGTLSRVRARKPRAPKVRLDSPFARKKLVPVLTMRNILLMLIATLLSVAAMFASESDNWRVKHPEWIWCDDFETDRLSSYFEYDTYNSPPTWPAAPGPPSPATSPARASW